MHEDAKPTLQRTVGQSAKRSWYCSQIEEEEGEEDDWQKEESLERRRREGSSLQAEVKQKVLELLVHERMSDGKGVKCTKEEKTVKGLSTVEMRGKPSSSLEEDTQEMRK